MAVRRFRGLFQARAAEHSNVQVPLGVPGALPPACRGSTRTTPCLQAAPGWHANLSCCCCVTLARLMHRRGSCDRRAVSTYQGSGHTALTSATRAHAGHSRNRWRPNSTSAMCGRVGRGLSATHTKATYLPTGRKYHDATSAVGGEFSSWSRAARAWSPCRFAAFWGGSVPLANAELSEGSCKASKQVAQPASADDMHATRAVQPSRSCKT